MDRDQILTLLCSAREHVAKCRTHPHLAKHADAGLKDINAAIDCLEIVSRDIPVAKPKGGLSLFGKGTSEE
jgi:hypothetical protein